MNSTEYQKKALRTEAPMSEELKRRVQDEALLRLLHCSLGLGSDVIELRNSCDYRNSVEEAGDLLWFLNVGFKALGKTMPEAMPQPMPQPIPEDTGVKWEIPDQQALASALLSPIGVVQDCVKARIFYRKMLWDKKPFEVVVEDALTECFYRLEMYCRIALNKTVEEVRIANIAKLSARYPDKFTEEAAVNRNTAAEYAAMEAK